MAVDESALQRVKIMWRDAQPLNLEPTIEDWRREVGAMNAKIPLPADMEVTEIWINGIRTLRVAAPNTSALRAVMHFHGGGYVIGTPESFLELAYRLSRACDAAVYLPEYRLAPEAPFPAAIDDGLAAFQSLSAEMGAASTITSGDSAGGGLALAVSLRLRELGAPQPQGIVAICPLVDLAATGASYVENATNDVALSRETTLGLGGLYLDGLDPRQTPLASPLYADLAGLPPVYAVVGSDEVLRDDSVRLIEKIKASGGAGHLTIVPDMQHIFPFFACLLPEGRTAIAEIGSFASSCLSASSS